VKSAVCLALLFLLGCKEKEPKPWWYDASFRHDVNPCDDPPPTEREKMLGYEDWCQPRRVAWFQANTLVDGGCIPPDDAWVRNPDGTCRLVR
jgi:hypothetical protein